MRRWIVKRRSLGDYLCCIMASCAAVQLAGCGDAGIEPGGGIASPTSVAIYKIPRQTGDVPEKAPDTGVETGPPGWFAGTVKLKGSYEAVPPRTALCSKNEMIPDESLVVSADGGIANVFVWLDKKPAWFKFEGSSDQKTDQVGCVFRPHATLAFVGQPLTLLNSDMVTHNVQTSPALNASINENVLPNTKLEATFRRAEPKPFSSSCSIHPWMKFWTLVLDHRFGAVTDADGSFRIPEMKPGKYKFKVWHERADVLEKSIEVVIKPGVATSQALEYEVGRFGGAK